MVCDVTDAGACERMTAAAVEFGGRLDGLVNAAGISGNGTVETCSKEDWDRVLHVNLTSMFLCSKHAVPALRAGGGGAIVNISSCAGFWGEPNTVAYNAAKGGVIALTRAMAMDHAPDGIRVNCVCPGYHRTPMPMEFLEGLPDREAVEAQVYDLIAARRMGEPEEMGRLIAFLLSDANPYMLGAVLVSDGGLTAGYPWHSTG